MNYGIVKNILSCPVCGREMVVKENPCRSISLVCAGERHHLFDAARSGYVSLCPTHSGGGDSAEAVKARTNFLSKGFYHAFSEKLCEIVKNCKVDGAILDAGCGEGYYTNNLALSSGRETLGFDLSKYAVDAAAKGAKRSGIDNCFYGVGSIFSLPVKDASVGIVTSVFAPICDTEFSRVLDDGGYLVVCGAGERHLWGLKKLIYDDIYGNGIRADLPKEDNAGLKLKLEDRVKVDDNILLDSHEDIEALFSMTPYYWRTSENDRKKLDGVKYLETEISAEFFIYRKDVCTLK